MTMLRTYRFPLHPTKAQETTLVSWLRSCATLYNAALEHRREAWRYEKNQRAAAEDRGSVRKHEKSVGYNEQTVDLTAIRAFDPAVEAVPVAVLRSALGRLDKAMKAFFRRCKSGDTPGFPRFRARDRYDTMGIGRVKITIPGKWGSVHVPKIGPVRFNAYRDMKGVVRSVEIRRSARGWWVCVACDLGAAPKKIAVRNAVGIDLGLTSFIATSDGMTVDAPRLLRRVENRLADHQRALELKTKGSKSRRKQRRVVARAHERVRDSRLDFHRKLAALLVAKYDLVAYEDLNVRGMAQGRLAKSIHDAGWSQFIGCLNAKAEEAGRWAVPVDPRGTSQRCSACGCTVSKDLSVRVHECPCGYVEDRDVNAAKNVLALGRSAVLTLAQAS